ncbi:MAG: hypothetical protein GF417_06655 [Candidatus Latescibacteria bacterium]|nr:hypothetical protein [bacterium]MBD3424098.1 hypothetical protein [Candidatus Latescibacterota bacterium]
MPNKILASAMVSILALLSLSCGEKKSEPGNQSMEWPDRTKKEDCIRILEMSFRHRDIERYRNLILEPDSTAIFPEGFKYHYLQDDMEAPVMSINYSDEIGITSGLFNHADTLDLRISPAGWERLKSFRGRPCEDCWKTEREELFVYEYGDRTFRGEYIAGIIIGPDPADTDKYLIYQIEGEIGEKGPGRGLQEKK